ncbi:HTH domain-containing protein [Mesorhizobium sp. NBSH29]|uniref:helix-turn-helix transcriptional regulator n=1 Tax=Mesorhizobium sp. NBSH29 TaxID=2654249 RepID=UPI0018965692|nr:YafY family protein [Mesorhizobium sp. NBSH29]QPC86353.1 HTH domain-containing protein [Mesorhizobium sp. NBSH29]
MRAARLFALLDQLRFNRKPVSAKALGGLLGVTERTIYRDMASLQAMGAPIRGEGGIGYQLERGYFLPPLHFDEDELDAVAIGIQLVSARGDDALKRAAERVAAKLEAVLPVADRGSVRQSGVIAYSAPSKAQLFLGPIRNAIKRRLMLNITYTDLNEHTTTRYVRPLGMTGFDSIWLLTAWCEARGAFRNFRADRLIEVKTTKERFAPETGKEFKDYLATL